MPPGKHALGVAFVRENSPKHGESLGKTRLCGDGLCVGYDGVDRVSKEYDDEIPFIDGTIVAVTVDVGKDVYLDLEQEAVAAFSRG